MHFFFFKEEICLYESHVRKYAKRADDLYLAAGFRVGVEAGVGLGFAVEVGLGNGLEDGVVLAGYAADGVHGVGTRVVDGSVAVSIAVSYEQKIIITMNK